MKTCPTCKRKYADDLAFCLDDGTPLTAAFVPHQGPDSDKTAILPAGVRPTAEPVPPRQTANEGPSPASSYPSPQFHDKRGGKLWVIVGGGIVIVIVVFVTVAGWFIWKASIKSAAESTRPASNSPNQNSGDANVSATETNGDSNSQSQTSDPATREWLNGVWAGDGYQTDTKTRWAVRLTVRDDTYSIDYPDIPCKGAWKLIEKNSQSASFTEVITEGLDQCRNNSHVMVEKLNASEITCRYANQGSRTVIATVVLKRKE
jgi:hypothetical protein